MKRVLYLVAAALVALLILAPMAMAQGTTQPKLVQTIQEKIEKTQPLPTSGGPAVGSVVLPAAALLLGSGILSYAILRRRR
jgi:hypothetical protein